MGVAIQQHFYYLHLIIVFEKQNQVVNNIGHMIKKNNIEFCKSSNVRMV